MNFKHNPFQLPQEIIDSYREIESKFENHIRKGEYKIARSEWEQLLDNAINTQVKLQVRFHKGGIFHNLGLIALFEKNSKSSELAFKSFVLAYAEDVISQWQGFAGVAENAPAAQNLVGIFGVDNKFFGNARATINSHIESLSTDLNDPRLIFKALLKLEFDKKEVQKSVKQLEKTSISSDDKYTIDNFPGIWKKRVFVGGNYRERADKLLEMKRVVQEKGYMPILASDFNDDEPDIHDHCLILLHNCKYAIFDLYNDSGYLMEVERTRDYNIKSLILAEKLDKKPTISAMMRTFGGTASFQEYETPEEMWEYIEEFLP